MKKFGEGPNIKTRRGLLLDPNALYYHDVLHLVHQYVRGTAMAQGGAKTQWQSICLASRKTQVQSLPSPVERTR